MRFLSRPPLMRTRAVYWVSSSWEPRATVWLVWSAGVAFGSSVVAVWRLQVRFVGFLTVRVLDATVAAGFFVAARWVCFRAGLFADAVTWPLGVRIEVLGCFARPSCRACWFVLGPVRFRGVADAVLFWCRVVAVVERRFRGVAGRTDVRADPLRFAVRDLVFDFAIPWSPGS